MAEQHDIENLTSDARDLRQVLVAHIAAYAPAAPAADDIHRELTEMAAQLAQADWEADPAMPHYIESFHVVRAAVSGRFRWEAGVWLTAAARAALYRPTE